MKKILMSLIIVCSFVLSGCDMSSGERTYKYDLPEGLHDCKIYKVNGDGRVLYVVRCPNSSTHTTYSSGKTISSVSVNEG